MTRTSLPPTQLFVRLPNWVGDVCMSLPSLELLLASGRSVTVCARPWAQDLLKALPLAGFVPMRGSFLADRAAVAARLSAAGGDRDAAAGLLLPDSLSSAAVFRLAGLRCGGYRDDGRSLLLAWPQRKPDMPVHAVRSWYALTRALLGAWGLPTGSADPPARLNLPLAEADRVRAEQALDKAGLAGRAFVLIAPTATGLHKGQVKVWPGFDALTRALQAEGVVVAMCPPPNEVAEARRNAPSALLLDPLPLAAFAALTTRAALVVCNDSGVSHLAAATGARQLTLFGVTRPQRSGPWSPDAICLGDQGAWPAQQAVLDRVKSALASAAGGLAAAIPGGGDPRPNI